jgi:hypothetical protein
MVMDVLWSNDLKIKKAAVLLGSTTFFQAMVLIACGVRNIFELRDYFFSGAVILGSVSLVLFLAFLAYGFKESYPVVWKPAS